jgi:hypothetical protein
VGVVGGGNSERGCCNASLIVLGMCLYVVWNSSGVSMAHVSLFWICGSVVILYVYNVTRQCWDLAFALPARLAYVGLGWISMLVLEGLFFNGKCMVSCGEYLLHCKSEGYRVLNGHRVPHIMLTIKSRMVIIF